MHQRNELETSDCFVREREREKEMGEGEMCVCVQLKTTIFQ